jgi:hypothetical protein
LPEMPQRNLVRTYVLFLVFRRTVERYSRSCRFNFVQSIR